MSQALGDFISGWVGTQAKGFDVVKYQTRQLHAAGCVKSKEGRTRTVELMPCYTAVLSMNMKSSNLKILIIFLSITDY
jgi:hypothetical protein